MAKFQFQYLKHERHPYQPGFERFTYHFVKTPVEKVSGAEEKGASSQVAYKVNISDTLIGQWDLDEDPAQVERVLYQYLIDHQFKTDPVTGTVELNAYTVRSPNASPYRHTAIEFPPTQPVLVDLSN